ncbi:MAG: hypothetical protein ACI87J_002376 [Colwellia sp.]|jgi:hypothetical protein
MNVVNIHDKTQENVDSLTSSLTRTSIIIGKYLPFALRLIHYLDAGDFYDNR